MPSAPIGTPSMLAFNTLGPVYGEGTLQCAPTALMTGKVCLVRTAHRGAQRGEAPLRFLSSPKSGGLRGLKAGPWPAYQMWSTISARDLMRTQSLTSGNRSYRSTSTGFMPTPRAPTTSQL